MNSWIIQKIKLMKQKGNSDSWSSSYQASKWALNHIELMEKVDYDQDSINQYYKENWQYSRIRNYCINNCKKLKNMMKLSIY